MTISWWNQIAVRQARIILLVALALGLLFSGIQIYLDYAKQKIQLTSTLSQIIRTSQNAAAEAAYRLDESGAREVATGLFAYEPILRVWITNDFGEILVDISRPENEQTHSKLADKVFGKQILVESELNHHALPDRAVGTIHVEFDPESIAIEFLGRAGIILVTGILRNTLLAFLLIWIAAKLITRPLKHLAQAFERTDPMALSKSKFETPANHEGDEFDIVVQAGNKMLSAVSEAVEAQKTSAGSLARRLRFERLLSEISTEFVSLPSTKIHSAIEYAVQNFGDYFNVDVVSKADFDPNNIQLVMSVGWASNQMHSKANLVESLSVSDMPVFLASLRKGEMIVLRSSDEVPSEASTEKRMMDEQNIKSAVIVPLIVSDKFIGTLNFLSLSQSKNWSLDDVSEAKVFGETIANALARKISDDALRKLTDQLEAENIYLQGEVSLEHDFNNILGNSDALKATLRKVEQVAPTDATVLITGESGTGKELIAHAVQGLSRRSDRPLIKINCAALAPSLLESEFFGHEKGSFTGATGQRKGRFELASGGTLFLDEIGELPLELQAKLLRVLQEGEFERVGGTITQQVDVRLIAATNKDLKAAVSRGEFREDLYFRLFVFPVHLPPLRDRKPDIEILVKSLVQTFAAKHGKEITEIRPKSMRALEAYRWPGNVRELKNVLERAVITSPGNELVIEEGVLVGPVSSEGTATARTLQQVERDYITKVLEESAWRIEGSNGAATRLDINPATLRSRLKKLSIEKPGT